MESLTAGKANKNAQIRRFSVIQQKNVAETVDERPFNGSPLKFLF